MNKLKPIQIWLAAGAAVVVVVIAAGWFLLVSPVRKNVADTKAATADLVNQNDSLQSQLDQLRAELAQVPAKNAALAAVAEQIPPTSDISGLYRLLDVMQQRDHIALSKFTPTAPTAATSAAPAAAAAPSASASPSTAGSSTTPATTATTTGPAVDDIPLSVTATGQFADVEEFLNDLETAPRLFTVKTITLAPQGSSGSSATTASTPAAGSSTTAGLIAVTISAVVYETPSGITVPPSLAVPTPAASTTTTN